jgi:hypothetical protein
MARFFTLQQAERLVRVLEPALTEAIASKARLESAQAQLRSISQKIALQGGMLPNREEAVRLQQERTAAAEALKAAFESIQETGCLVKDLDMGLLDFPTLYRGDEVYLCWKLGESRIEFWHGLDEGFRGRKPITDEFLANHRGDDPN